MAANATTPSDADHVPADALVVFGISGDLAKKMTFKSLYLLERRKLLDCPVIGVAVDTWSDDDQWNFGVNVERGQLPLAREYSPIW